MALPPHLAELESRLLGRFDEALQSYRRALDERLQAALGSVASSAAEIAPPKLESLLGDLDVDAVAEAPRQDGMRTALEALLAAARSTDRAETQSAVLDAMLDACQPWCDRAALVLTRDDGISVWGSIGFDGHPMTAQPRAWSEDLRTASRVTGSKALSAAEADRLADALGFGANGPALVVPMVLQDRLAALLWADRAGAPPERAALQLLVHLTAQRLELQALSDRAATSTLYDSAESDLAPLPVWSAIATPARVEDEESVVVTGAPREAGGLEGEADATDLWHPGGDAEPAMPPPADLESETPADLAEESGIDLAEPPAGPAEDDFEEMPAFELEEAATPLAEAGDVVPSDTAVVDTLGTVRLPVIEPPPRPVEERTAPLRIDPDTIAQPLAPASTHEIPMVEPERPVAASSAPVAQTPPPPIREPDLTEDATVLTMRRPEWATPPPPPAAVPPPPSPHDDANDRTASRIASRSTEVVPPPDVQGPGLAFAGLRAAAPSDQPAHEEAKRLARLLISEIKLYNEEQVLDGRRNRDLYHRLREDIDRSRQIYEERVDANVRAETDYFQQELVRSLAGGDPRALGI